VAGRIDRDEEEPGREHHEQQAEKVPLHPSSVVAPTTSIGAGFSARRAGSFSSVLGLESGNRPNRVLSGGAKAGHDCERWRGNALASPSIPITGRLRGSSSQGAIDKARTSVRESRAKPAQVTIEAGRPS
jgi:hypothetical protein